jgi:hypothetical protein
MSSLGQRATGNSKASAVMPFVPKVREEGVLYISIVHTTAVHHCFCGCGAKGVTPIRPTDWKLTLM